MKVVTPTGRISFPECYEMTEFRGKKRYRITMIFKPDPNDPDCPVKAGLQNMQDIFKKVAAEQWPKGVPQDIKYPLISGEDSSADGLGEGTWFIRFTSNRPVTVVGPDPKDVLDADSNKLYAGAWGRVSGTASAYDMGSGSQGVNCYFSTVQVQRDGDRLGGGGSNPCDDFEDCSTPLPVGEDVFA